MKVSRLFHFRVPHINYNTITSIRLKILRGEIENKKGKELKIDENIQFIDRSHERTVLEYQIYAILGMTKMGIVILLSAALQDQPAVSIHLLLLFLQFVYICDKKANNIRIKNYVEREIMLENRKYYDFSPNNLYGR